MVDQASFMKLFLRHQATLLAFIMSRGIRGGAADDVLQEAAVALWSKFGRFQPGTDFRAWAFEVVRYEISKHRRKARCVELPLDSKTLQELESATIENSDRLEREQGFLRRCLDKLSQTLRRLVDMRYGDEMPARRIAEKLSRSEGSVQVSLSRARRLLEECVRQQASGTEGL